MNHRNFILCSVFLLVCSYFDLRYRKIPNKLIICAACVGAAAEGIDFIAGFVPAMCISYIISHLRLIGGGDLKMFCVIIGLIGPSGFIIILFLGSVLCIAVRGALILNKRRTVRDTFPMAPYVLMGFVCWRCICVAS